MKKMVKTRNQLLLGDGIPNNNRWNEKYFVKFITSFLRKGDEILDNDRWGWIWIVTENTSCINQCKIFVIIHSTFKK